jgi:crossover junction endodeoxyribonuclease RuvC
LPYGIPTFGVSATVSVTFALGSVHLFVSEVAVSRVLAVDPGLTRCGVAVVEGGPGRSLQMLHVEVVGTSPQDPLSSRLLELCTRLEELLDGYAPDIVAVERVFSQHNVASAMTTAQAAGVALLLGARRGLATHEHTPTEVKASVTGNGRAEKAQVAAMVTRLLHLPEPPKPVDATDALALAICHLWQMPFLARLAAREVLL